MFLSRPSHHSKIESPFNTSKCGLIVVERNLESVAAKRLVRRRIFR